jgi:hypothetical protein
MFVQQQALHNAGKSRHIAAVIHRTAAHIRQRTSSPLDVYRSREFVAVAFDRSRATLPKAEFIWCQRQDRDRHAGRQKR